MRSCWSRNGGHGVHEVLKSLGQRQGRCDGLFLWFLRYLDRGEDAGHLLRGVSLVQHSFRLHERCEVLGGVGALAAWLPRVGDAGLTASVTRGSAAPVSLSSFVSQRSVTAPAVRAFDQTQPDREVVTLLVAVPMASLQRRPANAAPPLRVT